MDQTYHALKICSLNARGLRDNKKRNNLFVWLQQKQYDIILLQENYWTDNLKIKIQKELAGTTIINPGTEHSKRTAILFKNKLNFELLSIHKSEDSRILLINIKFEGETFTLINLYAPNIIGERKSFFNKIQKWIGKYSLNEQHVIVGGDFNHTEVNDLDRCSSKSQLLKDTSTVVYKSILSQNNLHDVWREMHPNKKQYTYSELSRLDKFHVSIAFLDKVKKTNIIHSGIKSDHKCITLHINLNTSIRGPGSWKLNTSILKDKLYCNKIKILLKKIKNDYAFLSKQLYWEMCKVKIKEFTISYCKSKQRVKKDILNEMEKN